MKNKTISLEILQLKDEETKDDNVSLNKNTPKHFKTNIEELNLLGESGEGETDAFRYINSSNTTSEFRIDSLNL